MADPAWGPIGRQVYERTYSRTKADGTKETFDETVARMVDGNLGLVSSEFIDDNERDDLIRLITEMKLLPAGRHWWVSGISGSQFLFNCHRAGFTDRLADHCGFTFDELMKGGGVGANYSREYVFRQKPIARNVWVNWVVEAARHPDWNELRALDEDAGWNIHTTRLRYHVEDSREGWTHALEYLCDMAQLEGPDALIIFDVGAVRQRGSAIKGFGGTASGPAPLIKMLQDVATVLRASTGMRLSPLEMMDIDHAIASCVVAGNVRRSARMSMMHWADPDIDAFIHLKESGGHWTTNMSVETDDAFWRDVKVPGTARELLTTIATGMLERAEPGIYNSSLASKGESGDVRCSNPCGEIALEEWENCNLGHVNLAATQSDAEVEECLELMARWLLRATFAEGMSWAQRQVVDRNRRIGVGILGFQEWLWTRFHLPYNCAGTERVEARLVEMQWKVRLAADIYAQVLGVNAPIKCTTVAPTGTTAKMAGVTEGIHPMYAPYFIRRVRYSNDDPQLPELVMLHDHEPDLMNPNTTVVSFVCRDQMLEHVPENVALGSNDLSIYEMLKVQRTVQRAWADNAVSYTCNIDPTTPVHTVVDALLYNGPVLKGTTVMPEGSYAQAPLERVTKEVYEATANRVQSSSADDCQGACPIR